MSWQAIEGRSRGWNDDNLKDIIYLGEIDTYLGRNLIRRKKLIKMSSIINIRIVAHLTLWIFKLCNRQVASIDVILTACFQRRLHITVNASHWLAIHPQFCPILRHTKHDLMPVLIEQLLNEKNETQLIIIPHVFKFWLLKWCVKKYLAMILALSMCVLLYGWSAEHKN